LSPTTLAETNIIPQLLEAIDETLDKLLGQKARTQIYDYLEKRHLLKRSEISIKPEAFSRAMSTLFGASSRLIEVEIVRNLCNKLGVKFEPQENFSFAYYLLSLKPK